MRLGTEFINCGSENPAVSSSDGIRPMNLICNCLEERYVVSCVIMKITLGVKQSGDR